MRRTDRRHQRDDGAKTLALMLAACVLAACSGTINGNTAGGAARPTDADALNQQAGQLLVAALHDTVTSRQALLELRMAGSAALPWITQALSPDADQRTSVLAPSIHAELLSVLAARGDFDAITQLRDSVSDDPVAYACRLAVITPTDHLDDLRAALLHSSDRVRTAALRRLRDGTLTAELRLAVTERARLDPAPSVRAAALETLAAEGAVSIDTLEARLADADPGPRAAAMRELARLDCAHAHARLARWLSDVPSHDGLAAVNALAGCGDAIIGQTTDHIRRALASSDIALRSQAATTADRLAWRTLPDWIATALSRDPVRSVRLALALAVRPTQPGPARVTLRELAAAPLSVVAVQAATVLASDGDAHATKVLRGAAVHPDAKLRRLALVALSRIPRHVVTVADGLDDAAIEVRLAAAGAVLRMTHAML